MFDYERHNGEVRRVWQAYRSGNPIRIPMILGISSRFYLLDPRYNTEGITYRQCFENPRRMIETQCRIQSFIRHHLPHDIEMGPPAEGWSVMVDFQNVFDAAWWGCEVIFSERQCPDTRPLYVNRKEALLEEPPPGPFDRIMEQAKNVHAVFEQMKAEGFEYQGVRLGEIAWTPGEGTDGVFTLLCQLRGTENTCMDLVLDPDYFHRAMGLLTDALIGRIRTWRQFLGRPEKSDGFALADDFVQMLSVRDYETHVLPYHRRIYEAFSDGRNNFMHLCGDASRHFPVIHEHLGVDRFDTGYPIDFDRVREDLGAEVEIMGGPHVELLLHGSVEQVAQRTREILSRRIKDGRFILREGNNLAPLTPLENITAMYETCKTYGRYPA